MIILYIPLSKNWNKSHKYLVYASRIKTLFYRVGNHIFKHLELNELQNISSSETGKLFRRKLFLCWKMVICLKKKFVNFSYWRVDFGYLNIHKLNFSIQKKCLMILQIYKWVRWWYLCATILSHTGTFQPTTIS